MAIAIEATWPGRGRPCHRHRAGARCHGRACSWAHRQRPRAARWRN